MHRRVFLVPTARLLRAVALVAGGSLLTCAAVFSAPPTGAYGAPPRTAPLIVIDPGHGGPYSNANANGLREKTVNLLVARALRERLIARGYRVILTRTTDRAVTLSDIPTWNYRSLDGSWHYRLDGVRGYDGGIPKDDLQARADIANRAGADLFISVHANGSRSRAARGFEAFASRRDALGITLSRLVQRSVVARTGLRDRGAKLRDFYVCRWTDMPAILVESAFITNPADAALLKRASFRARLAEGIAEGVDAFFRARPYRRLANRIGGATPEAHAAAVAAADFPTGTRCVIVAPAEEWAVVPGIVSLATSLTAPVLWTRTASDGMEATCQPVPTATAEALARLAPERIVLVGTHARLSSLDVTALAGAASLDASAVVSLAATDTASLAALIAERASVGPRGLVFVSSARDPRTSLAAAPVAASVGAPLLIASEGTIAPEARAFLNANAGRIRRFVLVGSDQDVPASLAGATPWSRFTGESLPALALRVNTAFFANRPPGSLTPIVADGRFGPEYLASAARAARAQQPLLPAGGRVLPALTRQWITNHRSAVSSFEVHDARRATPYLMDHMLRKADHL